MLARTPRSIDIADLCAKPKRFDALIDVRSPGEFELDHLPGAENRAVLDDLERAHIGTQYVQVSPFDARLAGAALVARNIARHLETSFLEKPRAWSPLIYCWRGGARSASMAHILAQVGWRVFVLEGGYRAYRRYVVSALSRLPEEFDFIVLCGATGTGKSRLLQALEQQGAQVVDLEALAHHRGSILGSLPQDPQPSQKWFESELFAKLSSFDRTQPVFIESESARIGDIRVPETLLDAMRRSACVRIEMSMPDRVELLLDAYAYYLAHPAELADRLDVLAALHGRRTIAAWKELVAQHRWYDLIEALLSQHYDPAYGRSTPRHYTHFDHASSITASLHDAARTHTAWARELVAGRVAVVARP